MPNLDASTHIRDGVVNHGSAGTADWWAGLCELADLTEAEIELLTLPHGWPSLPPGITREQAVRDHALRRRVRREPGR